MAQRFFYSGDRSIENGGFFYSLANWHYDYADAVRVTPCSDAGGPTNQFWVETLTANIPDGNDLQRTLDCIGMDELPKGAARRHAIIDALIAYGTYDITSSEVVQIGTKPDEYGSREFDPVHANTVLRANASLERYVRAKCREC